MILTQYCLKCLTMTMTLVKDSGCLYVVATPIGNLADISFRAIEVLQQCDLIVCEDTRHSKHLLQNYNIDTPTRSLHAHNEDQIAGQLISQLQSGQELAIISDAGTPLISDPGFPLVKQAHAAGIRVIPIPGASAVISLLSVAGLPVQPFTFHGFIPSKKSQRKVFYQSLLPLDKTHVFYESSHRIMASVTDLSLIFGAHTEACIGRELSKRFEHIYRGSLANIITEMTADSYSQKGEFVVAISGQADSQESVLNFEQESLARLLKPLMPPKQAAAVVASHYQVNKKMVYEFILNLAND